MSHEPVPPRPPPIPRQGEPDFEREVRRMFARIVGRYSLFNHVSTFGNDLLWRPRALWEVDRRLARAPRVVVDLGCGPGDLSYLLARHYPQARVLGLDFTEAMVHRALSRRRSGPEGTRMDFGVADALALPVRTSSVDLVTSAFLVRNIPHLERAFSEMRRVLRPGGMVLALEITEPLPPWFRPLFHAYFDRVMPCLGELLTRDSAHRYLAESLRHFPPRETVCALMSRAGLQRVEARPQSAGIVTVFLGRA
jgi:demethylmenaquinone methyltransferase/2-methoxy-6-polyprenyl-1,4-benzoquinol methylase